MNWCCVFWHGACLCGAELLRTGAASRAKIVLWPREQSQPSWLHTVPCLQCCSERMAQGRDTHSNPLLGWNPTPALTVGMSERFWHEININAWKGTSEGCALSLPCLAASQDHSWITSCVPALKHCQARSLFAATPLSPCCYLLFSPFPHFCCIKIAHLTESITVKISLWAQVDTPFMQSRQLEFIVSLIIISTVKSKLIKQLFQVQPQWC